MTSAWQLLSSNFGRSCHGRRVLHNLSRSLRSDDVHRTWSVLHLSSLCRDAGPQQMVPDDSADGSSDGNIYYHLQKTWTRVEMVSHVRDFFLTAPASSADGGNINSHAII